MKDLLDPEVFFDGDLSDSAFWHSQITGRSQEIQVLWTNDPYDDSPLHQGSEPLIQVHESFARIMTVGDRIVIDRGDYEVREISPFDADGFAIAALFRNGYIGNS